MVQDYVRPLEIDFLLIVGVFMVILGLVLFEASAGRVALSGDSIYGLSLVLVAFEAIAMGKTPFGDVRRSWLLLGVALCVATLGMFACFIPRALTSVARVSVGVVLLAGGLTRLLQLFLAKDRARVWMREGGVLAQMTVASALAYALRIAAGALILAPGFIFLPWAPWVFTAFGASLLSAGWTLRRVSMAYPPVAGQAGAAAGRGWLDDPELPLSPAYLVLMGVALILLGVLLFPVGFGLLPYSPDGQFGLMLVLMAIQALALGATPLGDVHRPTLMLAIGLIFAALGIVASIVPGLLTGWLQILIGVLTVGNGAKLLIDAYRPLKSKPGGPAHSPPRFGALGATVAAVGALNVVFGVATLVPDLLAVPALAVLSILMGLALFRLVLLLRAKTLLEPKPAQPTTAT